jgi:hypothetical protein
VSTDDDRDSALAEQIFAFGLSLLRTQLDQHEPNGAGYEYRSALFAEHWRAVRRHFDRLVEQSLNNPIALVEFEPAAVMNQKVTPDRFANLGAFEVAVRVLGERSGEAAGRPPVLEWKSVELDAVDIPDKLAGKIREIPAGKLGGLAKADMEFCPAGVLWHLWFPNFDNCGRDGDAFVIWTEDAIFILNWTNGPIYQLNDLQLFRFSKSPRTYIRCFFHLVRGELGRFIVLEDGDDVAERVAWDPDQSETEIEKRRIEVEELVRPLERLSINAAGELVFSATVLFKNALFKTDVVIDPSSQLRLENEDLLLEELPVNFT